MLIKLYNITLKYNSCTSHISTFSFTLAFGLWIFLPFICLFILIFLLPFLLDICIYFTSFSVFLILTGYLDCRWRFILTGFYILSDIMVLEVQDKMSYILIVEGLLRTICGTKTDIPKGICLGFTLNLKCVHLIGNFWLLHCICGDPGQIYICLVVIHRTLVLPVSKQNMIQRQSEFRQPVGSVLKVKRSLKHPGP